MGLSSEGTGRKITGWRNSNEFAYTNSAWIAGGRRSWCGAIAITWSLVFITWVFSWILIFETFAFFKSDKGPNLSILRLKQKRKLRIRVKIACCYFWAEIWIQWTCQWIGLCFIEWGLIWGCSGIKANEFWSSTYGSKANFTYLNSKLCEIFIWVYFPWTFRWINWNLVIRKFINFSWLSIPKRPALYVA